MTSIRTQAIIVFLIVSLLSSTVVGYLSISTSQKEMDEDIRNHLISVAQSRANHLETFLKENKQIVSSISLSPVFNDFLKIESDDPKYTEQFEQVDKNLENLVNSYSEFYEVFLIDKNGIIVASSDGEKIGLDKSDNHYFIKGKNSTYIKDAYFSETTQKKSITISSPVLDGQTNDLLGVIVARVEQKELDEIMMDRAGLGETGEVYLVNKDYYMITPSRFEEDTFLKQKVDTENTRNCFLHFGPDSDFGEGTTVFQNYRGVDVLGTNVYIPEMKWALLAEMNEEEAFYPISQMRSKIATTSLLFSIFVSIVALLFVNRVTKPIMKLKEGIETISDGGLDFSLDIRPGDEIEVLLDSFNEMTSKLKKSKDEMDEYATKLEQKVAERTEELENKIAELDSQRLATMNILRDVSETKEKLEESANELERSNEKLQKEISEREQAEKEARKNAEELRSMNDALVATQERMEAMNKDLETSQKELDQIFNTAADGVLVIDKDSNILQVNNTLATMAGLTKEEIFGKKCYNVLSSHLCKTSGCALTRILGGEERVLEEVEKIRTDGTKIPCTMTAVPYFDVNGELMGIVEDTRDITDCKEVESKLKENAEELRDMNEELLASQEQHEKLLFEVEGRAKELNCLYEVSRLVDDPYSSWDGVLRGVVKLIPISWQYPEITCARICFDEAEYKTSNFKETVWKLSSDIVMAGKVIGSVEVYYLEEKPEADEGPFRKEERDLIDGIARQMAITSERKAAQKEQEKLLQSIGNQKKELNCLYEVSKLVVDPNYTLDMILNEVVCIVPTSWQYPEITCARICFDEAEYKTSNFNETDWKLSSELIVSGEAKGSIEVYYLTEKPQAVYGPFLKEERNLIDALATQLAIIIERKQSEEKQKRMAIEITEKNKELEQVVYVASHDLRSPLVNVQGFSKELDYTMKELETILQTENIPPEASKKILPIFENDIPNALKFISASVDKMDSLLSGLLRLSRLGRAALEFTDLDMGSILLEIEKSFEFRIKEVGANLEIGELPPCRGDAVQINQVFFNLVDNALKYLDPNRQGKIKITGKKEGDSVIYCVEDNGIGIPKGQQKKIFEIFHRLDPESTRGEGLGLTLVTKILARNGGDIWVESSRGAGSKFFLSLPSIKEEDDGGENDEQ